MRHREDMGPAGSADQSQSGAAARWAALITIAAITGLASTPSLALQVLDAQDGVAVEAILSTREPTRIRIDGAAITDVVGAVHASGCQVSGGASSESGSTQTTTGPGITTGTVQAPAAPHPAAEALLECDLDKGEVYIRPLGDSRKPLNLFIASAHATYTLVLRRADTPADTIVIKDRSRPLGAVGGRPASTGAPRGDLPDGMVDAGTARALPRGAAAQHVRTIKALLTAMATDRVPADLRIEDLLQPMQLWAEAKLTLVRRYEGRGLVGELYLLQNSSNAPLVVSEPEFDRPDDARAAGAAGPTGAAGATSRTGAAGMAGTAGLAAQAGPVLGVAVARHNLRPGDQTPVYVIRQGARP